MLKTIVSRPSVFVGLCTVLVALGVFSACSRRESPVDRGNREKILHRGISHDLASLDPHLATQTSDYSVLSALLEGLTAEDPIDLHPVPGVAERWDVSPDGLSYTFYLRANAKWSNGDPSRRRISSLRGDVFSPPHLALTTPICSSSSKEPKRSTKAWRDSNKSAFRRQMRVRSM